MRAPNFMWVCCRRLRKTSSHLAWSNVLAAPFMRGRHVFFSKDQQNVEEIRAHLQASPEWTNIPPEVVRLFAHGGGTGVFLHRKGVAEGCYDLCGCFSHFLWLHLARTPTGGHERLLMNWMQFTQKFERSAIVPLRLLACSSRLDTPYAKFLETTLPRLRCCVAVRLSFAGESVA